MRVRLRGDGDEGDLSLMRVRLRGDGDAEDEGFWGAKRQRFKRGEVKKKPGS